MPSLPHAQTPALPAGWLGALRWPRPCVLCSTWARSGLCRDCTLRFLPVAQPRCPRCALPQAGGQVCGACLRAPPPYSHCVALADYGFPWDRLITRLKFQQQPELAGLLADALAGLLLQSLPQRPPPQWLLPVPLSPQRLQERGCNQAWELARRLSGRLGLPARHGWLLRLRDTPHQVGTGRAQRLANLRHALWVPPEAARALSGSHVALVDDVLTTGATAAAASQALLAAGAAEVQVWVIARTPAPGG